MADGASRQAHIALYYAGLEYVDARMDVEDGSITCPTSGFGLSLAAGDLGVLLACARQGAQATASVLCC